MDKQMMYDYNSIKSFWTKFFKDWQQDVKESQKEIFKYWSDFFNK